MAKKQKFESRDKASTVIEKKPFYKKWWFITIIALVIIGAIFGPDEEEKQVKEDKATQNEQVKEDVSEIKEKNEEPEEEFAITDDMNEDKKIENIIKKVVEDQYDSHELVNNPEGALGDIKVNTYFPADAYWDGKRATEAQDTKIVEILKQLKEHNINYSYLVYEASSDFTDQYGNENKSTLMTVLISKEEADKINYDNFQTENLKSISDEYYVHPSVQ